jgi:hypothetical protein
MTLSFTLTELLRSFGMSLNLLSLVNPLSTLAVLAVVQPLGAAVFGLVILGYKAHDAFLTWAAKSSSDQSDQIFSLEQEILATKDIVAKLQHDVKNIAISKLGRS